MKELIEDFKKKVLPGITDPRERAETIFRFISLRLDSNHDIAKPLLQEEYEANKNKGFLLGEGFHHYYTMIFAWKNNEFEKAVKEYTLAVNIFREENCRIGESAALTRASYLQWDLGNYSTALEYVLSALKINEDNNFQIDRGWCFHALGVFHSNLKDYAAAINYFEDGIKIFKTLNNEYGIARINTGIGTILIEQGHYNDALGYINSSLVFYKKVDQKLAESRGLNDLGVVQRALENFKESESNLLESLRIRTDTNHFQGIITTYSELGELYLQTGDYDKALTMLEKALEYAMKIKVKPKIFRIHSLFAKVYKMLNRLDKALEHTEKHFEVKSEVAGEDASNKLNHLQTKFATERADREAEIHRLRNVELRKAFNEIEEKNKNILDSINYAQRIQKAILPHSDELKNIFPESFVLFRPKDVVSGDFYWFYEKVGRRQQQEAVKEKFQANNSLHTASADCQFVFLCVADCTGHGVPGALMSMIATSLLNQTVKEKGITSPALVLDEVRNGIINALRQKGNYSEQKDGLDAAFCCYNPTTRILTYAGANNPVWVLHAGEFLEIQPDKQPVGFHIGEDKPFTNHNIELSPGDSVYLFTDGYADQFGGPREKKFKYAQLQKLVLSIASYTMSEQRDMLQASIEQWKGKVEQTDDITIVGMKV